MIKKYLFTDPLEATEYLKTYDFTEVSFDVESLSTSYYERWCHGGSYEKGNPTGISFCNGKEAVYIDTCGWNNFQMFKFTFVLRGCFNTLNKGKGKTFIAHNIPFDMGCLYKYGIKLWNAKWFDTMTASHLIDENRPKGLKYLAQEVLGEEDTEDWKDVRFDKELFHEYALNDAIWTWELYQRFKDELVSEGVDDLFYNIEMPYQICLLQMAVNGVLIDLERVEKTRAELEVSLAELEKELLTYLGKDYVENKKGKLVSPINFNSPVQLREILFDTLGLEVVELTPTNQPSTGKATLSQYKTHEFVIILNKYKIVQKLLTGFFKPLPKMVDPDGRVRPNFRNTGTVTGRLSCSKPNLQQLPNLNSDFPVDTRACFIAPPGKKLIAIDYSQQEVRIMAELSQDPTLINIILRGGDIHMFSANNVFSMGLDEETFYADHPDYEKTKKKYKAQRNKGKIFSFGIPYGMTEHKAAKDFGITPEEGKVLLDNFFAGFPKLQQSIEDTHREAEKNLFVTTYTGRRRRFKLESWGKLDQGALRQSFNFLIQSFGADLIRMASVKALLYSAKNPEAEIKQIMSVHDEIVIEVKEEYAEKVARDMEKIFESVWTMCVPLKAEADIGDNYSEAK